MRKPKRATVAVVAVLIVLAASVGVLAVLNRERVEEKQQRLDDEYFVIAANETDYTITMVEFMAFEQREFQATLKKNGLAPESRVFAGVPFAELLQANEIDTAERTSAVFEAADGYVSAIPLEEALDGENCYIVIDRGGDGPFRMILAKDQFSQRWCKLLTDITLK